MRHCKSIVLVLLFLCTFVSQSRQVRSEDEESRKKIVLIAGPKSHGPVGNRIHDYPWSVKLIKVMLDNSNVRDKVRVEYHLGGWPENPGVLDDADSIMVISDGRDGDKYQEAPHFRDEQTAARIQEQIDRGCGFATFHFSTFAPDSRSQQILDWSGGYFDWEENGQRKWYSAIQVQDTDVIPAAKDHPVNRGVTPFKMREEFYYNIRFADDDSVVPLWTVPTLKGREPNGKVVAWAKQRSNGGRGFGTTCGHFYDNWKHPSFRKTILNALVWTAGLDPPKGGVEAEFYTHEQITLALANGSKQSATIDAKPIRGLIFAGNDAHKWHNWEKTTPAIKQLLERDPRIRVEVSFDIEDLSRKDLSSIDFIVQNYANWHDPTPLSEKSRNALVSYLEQGGGLLVVHFANGAFHYSLPEAGASDWPEYRNIVRRVWDHHGKGEQKSGHDAFGRFQVKPTKLASPLTAELQPFEVEDELYFRQAGTEPIEPLIVARSKVTGRDEPLAWTYSYGKGRIFQTLLGHSEKTYDTFEPREMLRRAAAWVSRRNPLRMESERDSIARPANGDQPSAAKPSAGPRIAPGKFGNALVATSGPAVAKSDDSMRRPPLTVECWVRLRNAGAYNILIASETKASLRHWELFSMPRTGYFTAYMPGMNPDHIRSEVNICDDRWRHVALVWERDRARLFVDGKLAADSPVSLREGDSKGEPLSVGALVSRGLGCNGLIDDVRISRGATPIEGIHDKPHPLTDSTLCKWTFDELADARRFRGQGQKANDAIVAFKSNVKPPAARPAAADHWGRTVVGFDWTESDSVDGRWNQTNVGRFLACTVPIDGKPVLKGLTIRVGKDQQGTVCYDTKTMQLRGAWSGGFLRFDPARYGLIRHPQVAGTMAFSAEPKDAWPNRNVRYLGAYLHEDRITLRHRVDAVEVLESPWFHGDAATGAFQRTMQIGPAREALRVRLAHGGDWSRSQGAGEVFLGNDPVQRRLVVGIAGASHPRVRLESDSDGSLFAVIAPHDRTIRFGVVYQPLGTQNRREQVAAAIARLGESRSFPLDNLTKPGRPLWTEQIATRGVVADSTEPYVIDTITLPYRNPYRALMFVGGHDFFSNGDLALCTVHGDVWVARGIDDRLEKIRWKRFATGLFQPLGLRIVSDQVYVLGRDQITRLHDQNSDGEADYYENFNNDHRTSPGTHDYVTCLETDGNGNFYFVHATQGVVRVSPDGTKQAVVATGFRNPNGMGVRPDGLITVSPQEGEWTPGSCIADVRSGGYYGYGGPRVTATRTLGYDPPMCWIPRRLDNSSGGQVWALDDRWGPLKNQLIHLSFGQCAALLALREEVDGLSQGGVFPLPWKFQSGVMRGRINPRDGQVYVSGMTGWVSSAVQDGCLQRIRYTGKPLLAPESVRTHENGIALTFTLPLDRAYVEDPDRYDVEQWNYIWSGSYGSEEYLVSDPRRQGRDSLEVRSATLLDERTLFLELPQLEPVMQMGVRFDVKSVGGLTLRETYYHTIHRLSSPPIDPARLVRRARPGALPPEIEDRLERGLVSKGYEASMGGEPTKISISRMAAFAAQPGKPPVARPIRRTVLEGFLEAPLRGTFAFRLAGMGKAELRIRGETVLSGSGDLMEGEPAVVELHKGFNRVQVVYQPTAENGSVRVLWRSEEFPWEPLPPESLFHDGGQQDVARFASAHRGRALFAEHRCARCHQISEHQESVPPDLAWAGPSLKEVAARTSTAWLAHRILNPGKIRNHSRMPQMLTGDSKTITREAADLAAFLTASEQDNGGDIPRNADAEAGMADQGLALFESLACIACHRFSPPDEEDEFQRTSLHYAAAKFPDGRLAKFLIQPQRHDPTTRMPDFHLSADEAHALEDFIRERSKGILEQIPEGDAKRGQELFRAKQCNACHATSQSASEPQFQAPRLFAKANRQGCLDQVATATRLAPKFGFDARQLADLESFLALSPGEAIRETPVDRARRWMRQLRCAACHDRDGDRGDRGVVILEEGELGLPPEVYPGLTWAGEKLQSEWIADFLTGKVEGPVRPWLRGRMPSFPAYASELALGLAHEHAVPRREPSSTPDPALAKIGDSLTRKINGLDCRQCHAVGAQQPTGDARTKIAPGINFALAAARLRQDYFHRFMIRPARYEIGTKMPRFALDGKTTQAKHVLDGDAGEQFRAIWHFLQTVEEDP